MTSPTGVPNHSPVVFDTFTRRKSGLSIVLSLLLIVCGFLGILLPIEMSLGVVIVIAWLLMISGVLQFVHVFRCKDVGGGTWRALIALLYLATGLYLRFNLGLGLAALTLALIAFFLSQGLIDTFAYVRTRKSGATVWLLFSGAITLVLALMIWRHWPSSSLWVVGALVGINMIITGTTRLMLSLPGFLPITREVL